MEVCCNNCRYDTVNVFDSPCNQCYEQSEYKPKCCANCAYYPLPSSQRACNHCDDYSEWVDGNSNDPGSDLLYKCCSVCKYKVLDEWQTPCCFCANGSNLVFDELNTKVPDVNTNPDNDPVNHPSHYCQGDIECIDAMEAAFGKKVVADFCMCNVFKYIFRHKNKNGMEDIEKAIWYLEKYIELAKERLEIV